MTGTPTPDATPTAADASGAPAVSGTPTSPASPTEPAAPSASATPTAPETWDAVVVGGGIAGLVAARELAIGGLHPLVLEAWKHAGGVIGRHVVAGLTLDAGAESYATRGGHVAELAAALGVTDQVASPAPIGAWVRLRSGTGRLPRVGLLGIPANPWAPDVRHTVGILGALRASVDRMLPATWGARDGRATLGGLVRRRQGARVLDRLVRPVVSGVHAADPDDLGIDAVTPGLRAALAQHGSLGAAVVAIRSLAPAGAAVAGFDGGLLTLVDALVADIEARGGTVRTGARMTDVSRDDTAETRFTLSVAGLAKDTPPSVVRTDRLVLATHLTADRLPDLVPGLEPLVFDAGADVVLATLVVDEPALDAAPRGTGILVAPEVTDVDARALTHATTKWPWLARAAGPGRHVLRLSYGSRERALSLDALTDLALTDASNLLGIPLTRAQLVDSARVVWSGGLPRPSEAHRATVERARAAVGEVPGLAVCGAWVAGNGIASVVPDARRAAAAVLTA